VTKRTFVAKNLAKEPKEVETYPLWHGTKQESIMKIAHSNFDRGLSGTVGERNI